MTTDVTKMAFMKAPDELMTVNFDDLAKRQKEIIAAREAQPQRQEGPAGQLQKLRRELFCLEQRAASTETYCNNKGDESRLAQQYLNDALAKKKAAVTKGNFSLERNLEHTINRLEGEFDIAEREFHRARKIAAQAARELKEWPHRERVAELEKVCAGKR